MALVFRSRDLAGGLRAPLAFIGASQGANNACGPIAVHLGAEWCRKGPLAKPALRALLQRGLHAYQEQATSGADLLDVVDVSCSVPGVLHLGGSLAAAAAAVTADGAATTLEGALHHAIGLLGSNVGFIALTHAGHTVTLLPDWDSGGRLVALNYFNFIGNQLYPSGDERAAGRADGFAVKIIQTAGCTLAQRAAAVLHYFCVRRYDRLGGPPHPHIQFDVFGVEPGA
jgi:hypothetical protein